MEIKNKTKSFKIMILIMIALVFAGSAFAGSILLKDKPAQNNNDSGSAKDIKTASISELEKSNYLSVQGTVKAASKVDLVALGNGTAYSLNFEVGDKITTDQPLVFLKDDMIATNYANAQNNLSNLERSYYSTEKFTAENIRQAELGIKRAKESLEGAQLALNSAKENYANAVSIQTKTKNDLKENAIVQYGNYLAAVKNFLDQASYILIKNDDQLPGIDPTLSVRNLQLLVDTRADYDSTLSDYKKIAGAELDAGNIGYYLKAAVDLIAKAKDLSDSMVEVLNNTPSSNTLSGAVLSSQKSSFVGLKSSLLATQSSAQATMQNLQNADLINKRELDNLQNGIKAAENQFKLAQVGYDNAISGQSSSINSKDQQLSGSEISLDNARGQLRLLAEQLDNLTVKSPISGQITSRLIEQGSEVRAGQKIGEISQTGLVKIIMQVSAEDSAKVRLGQEVKINKLYAGKVNNINPAADPSSKKIQMEILFENKNNELIPETFVTIDIPTNKALDIKTAGFFIPLKVITISQNENYIFTVKNEKAIKVPIELLRIEGETAEIKTDLQADDLIVIEGNKSLNDGDQVAIIR